ncbi:MAG: pyruvate kinase [Phycisphaerales bacterium]
MTPVRPTLSSIVATIGPASDSPEMVAKLIDAGVAVFRFNFSHGTFEDHRRRLEVVRTVASHKCCCIAVLGDLPGPKIRIGQVPDPGITLAAGQDFLIDPALQTSESAASDRPARFGCTYTQIGRDVQPGHRVLINDGAIRAVAMERQPEDAPTALRCRVTTGGLVTSKKGINLPQTDVSIPALTERDWACIEWAVRHGMDFLALSFVRSASEVRTLRERLAGMCSVDGNAGNAAGGAAIPVIAKIETPQAVAAIDEIAKEADAMMVARGDLGVEMDIAVVPIVQKRILAAADKFRKPCIVATQMLESMIHSPTPTRAEAGDVATAVIEGADAVMLSAESATGQYPVLAVETMRRIIGNAETWMRETGSRPTPTSDPTTAMHPAAAVAHGVYHIAKDVGAKLIVCWSQRGGTARYLSQAGLDVPIIAYSSSETATRRMVLMKGVVPLLAQAPTESSLSEWNRMVDDELLKREWLKPGDQIVLVAGRPLGVAKPASVVAVHSVGDKTTGFYRHP